MNKTRDWKLGTCNTCGQRMLIHPETKLCLWCRLDALEEEISALEQELEQSRAVKLRAYGSLIEERKKTLQGLQ